MQMIESSEENSSDHIKHLLSKNNQIKNNIVYIPEQSEVGKNNSKIINCSKIDNTNEKTKNNSNGYLNYSENHFKSSDIQYNKRFNALKNNNNQNISNGETIENDEHNKFKGNYDLIRKKLLLISKKEKKINKDKKTAYKIKAKSQTSKMLNKLLYNNNKEEKDKIKDYKNKIKEFEGRRKMKSKTIYNKIVNSDQLTEWKSKFNQNLKKQEKSIDLHTAKYKTIMKRNTFKLKTENSNKTNKERANYLLPTLTISRPSDKETHRHFKNYIDNSLKNLYKSNFRGKMSSNLDNKKKNSLPKTLDFMNSFKFNKNSFNDIINAKNSLFSNFQRKNTFQRFNSTMKSNLISNTLLNTYKLYDNKKYLKKLKENLKNEHSHDFFEDWKNLKKKIVSSSLSFIDNKINNWMLEFSLKNKENDQKIIFNGKNYSKNKKEKKQFRIVVEDFIIKLFSPQFIANYYFKYHKGNIEQNILIYLQKTFFDFSLPSYIFEYKYNKLYLSKIPNKNIRKIILKQKTIDKKKIFIDKKEFISPKKCRRFSYLELIRKNSVSNNALIPLSDSEKKSILYLYYLDIDLDNNTHENINLENDDKDSFLKLLRGNSNETETHDLLINKFISRYIKKNGTNSNTLPFNKKNSLKNNTLINKVSSESKKNNKMPLFKHNFFSRNEIKRSSYKIDDIKKKKSLLEYNLLFDPSLTGYNNLISEVDVIYEPNTERTIINRRKIKELQELKNKQLTSFLISSGGMKTDKNIIVMKTLDLINQYNHKNKGNINSLTSSIKDCNYVSFVKFYRACNCGPNAKDKDGNSLLSLAVKSSCLEIVKFLLDEKANPNLQNVSLYILIYIFLKFRCLEILLYMKL